MEKEVDRISELPSPIIHQILIHLPLKDAVRTSLLSSQWRYMWTGIPVLVFNDQGTGLPLVSDVNDKLVRIIDNVLVLYEGPIDKFELSHWDFDGDTATSAIDRWILHLSRQSLKELVLNIWKGIQAYKIPSNLFLCLGLVHLELLKCSISLPSGFRGFKNLKSLYLHGVVLLTHDAVENLISSSPLLETLHLWYFKSVSSLKIDASNLRNLDVRISHASAITFGSTRSLFSVSVDYDFYGGQGDDDCSMNMLEFFSHMSLVRALKLQGYTMKHLATELVPRMKLKLDLFINLKFLSVSINFTNAKEVLLVQYLLRSSPNLVEFSARQVDLNPVSMVGTFWDEEISPLIFKQLRFVTVYNIMGSKLEMGFIKGMLSYAPVLEKMTVWLALSGARDSNELLKELLEFRCASALSRIVYLEVI